MKTLLSLLVLFTTSVFGQTTIIAHKSHSGTAATFFAEPSSNFGEPPSRVVSIEKLNDTTVIQHWDQWHWRDQDTLYNHPILSDPNISVDSMKKIYNYGVEFKNFEKKPVSVISSDSLPTQVKKQVNEVPVEKKAEKKKRKSGLLWLWGIGGGTFVILVVSRRKRINLQHA